MNANIIGVFGGDEDEEKKPRKPKNQNNGNGAASTKKPFQTGEMITRKQRRKDQRKGLQPQEKPDETKNPEEEKNGLNENILNKAEKPFLIKTTNHEEDTPFEIGLEAFVQKEYTNEVKETMEELDPEDDYGSTEYKLKLVHPSKERLEHLTTQMKFRLNEGYGEAKYIIGAEDDGTPTGLAMTDMLESLKTLCTMASSLTADVIIPPLRQGYQGKLAQILVRRNNLKDGIKLDIKIMLLGDNQAGKSTLIGVLTSGQSDNGSGSARTHVFSHKHEVLTGQTSAVSHHVCFIRCGDKILGFDSEGNVTNHCDFGNPSWEQIIDMSTKILTFIDIGGHQRYTTKIVTNLVSMHPDYTLIAISAVQGITKVTEEHFKLAILFQVPIMIVITHADKLKERDLDLFTAHVQTTLSLTTNGNIPTIVSSNEDVVFFSRVIKEEDVLPIFRISSVTGQNLDLFSNFLNLLPVNNQLLSNKNLHTEFYIHTTFEKAGKIILAGTVIKGSLRRHQILNIGPDDKGQFRNVEVANIHCKKVDVRAATCGQTCSVWVKPGKLTQAWLDSNKNAIRRGMVLVDGKANPQAGYEFTAEITPIEDSGKRIILWENYEPVIVSRTTNQVCTLVLEYESVEELKPLEFVGLRSVRKLTDAGKWDEENKNDPLSATTATASKKKKLKSRSQDDKLISKFQALQDDLLSAVEAKKLKITEQNADPGGTNGHSEKNKETESLELSIKSKVSFENKAKELKKNAFKGFEDIFIKKKKSLRHLKMDSNKSRVLRLRFKYHPEYIMAGQKIFINDSTMKAIGVIKEIFYDDKKAL